MVIRTIANDFIPAEIVNYFSFSLQNLSHHFSSQLTIVIEEFRGLAVNQVFEAADIYLGSKTTPSIQRLKVGKSEKENKLAVSMDRDGVLIDVYENVEMKWKLVCTQVESVPFRKPYHGDLNASLRWDVNEIKLKYPMTFKTLAMDSELKKAVMEDLENFINGEEYYKRVGKAWKRGYLLYGPPGTGKSSFIASMANHLKFDIYDLDLTDVQTNSDLRFLLLTMPSRSILVVEDIDCSIKLENRESENEPQRKKGDNQVSKGLLNFIDGLWSCCGEECIIIFTTNHKEQLDPALLRPGRMDMHIHMSYCNASIFKQLAFNYLGISNHGLFQQIERLLEEVNVSPAEVAGELMKNANEETAFQGLLKFLHQRISERDNKKKKKN
ncbi:hypothetical protein CRYUN_Cryun37aG0014800 [Craigia yunnanensis]